MALFETLSKVEKDILDGKLRMARKRLWGLRRAYPEAMIVRHKLGEVSLLLGYKLDAGRWLYLVDVKSDAEIKAVNSFVARKRGYTQRIVADLQLMTNPERLDTDYARKRIQELNSSYKVPFFESPGHVYILGDDPLDPQLERIKVWAALVLLLSLIAVFCATLYLLVKAPHFSNPN